MPEENSERQTETLPLSATYGFILGKIERRIPEGFNHEAIKNCTQKHDVMIFEQPDYVSENSRGGKLVDAVMMPGIKVDPNKIGLGDVFISGKEVRVFVKRPIENPELNAKEINRIEPVIVLQGSARVEVKPFPFSLYKDSRTVEVWRSYELFPDQQGIYNSWHEPTKNGQSVVVAEAIQESIPKGLWEKLMNTLPHRELIPDVVLENYT